MVKRASKPLLFSLILLCGSISAQPQLDTRPEVRIECNKTTIYSGEAVTCDYVLYSHRLMEEIEVAKFPEFRGFWKQNLVLRQSKIMLHSASFNGGGSQNKSIIATYILIPMVGEASPEIFPMKLAIRENPNTPDSAFFNIQSNRAPLKVKPLPPPPQEIKGFSGAVGYFDLTSATNRQTYSKDSPAVLRYYLRGQGNFPEITDLEIELPAEIKVLSRRSFGQGMGDRQTKTFEMSVQIESNKTLQIPPAKITYFDPAFVRYTVAKTNPIEFVYNPSVTTRNVPTEEVPLDLGKYNLQWTKSTDLWSHPLYQLANILLFIGLLSPLLMTLTKDWKVRRENHPRFLRRKRVSELRALLEAKETESFLKQSKAFAEEALLTHLMAKGSRPVPSPQLAKTAAFYGVDKSLIQAATNIADHYNRTFFAPQKSPPPDLEVLWKDVEKLVS